MTQKKYLWDSIIGSHMWNMNHENSDMDIARVFLMDIDDLLIGKRIFKGKQWTEEIDGTKHDYVEYELGHVVKELTTGNINFLWLVMTPLHHSFNHRNGGTYHTELREIVSNNLSKNYFHSITGLSRNMLSKYFNINLLNTNGEIKSEIRTNGGKILAYPAFPEEWSDKDYDSRYRESDPRTYNPKNLPDWRWKKKVLTILRTLLFGYNLIKNKKIKFKDPREKYDKIRLDTVISLYKVLENIYEENPRDLPEEPPKEKFNQYLIDIRKDNL